MAIENWANIKVISHHRKFPGAITAIIERAGIQQGEIDCIYIAHENFPCIFLTDDLTARITAEKLSIEVHGTVGIIAYAVRQKWLSIPKAEESLNLLYHRSSLFITYAIIESAIKRLKRIA